jgi:hypothetical protein
MFLLYGLNYVPFLVSEDRHYLFQFNPLNLYHTVMYSYLTSLPVLFTSDLVDLLETIHIMLQLMEKLQARGALRVCYSFSCCNISLAPVIVLKCING